MDMGGGGAGEALAGSFVSRSTTPWLAGSGPSPTSTACLPPHAGIDAATTTSLVQQVASGRYLSLSCIRLRCTRPRRRSRWPCAGVGGQSGLEAPEVEDG